MEQSTWEPAEQWHIDIIQQFEREAVAAGVDLTLNPCFLPVCPAKQALAKVNGLAGSLAQVRLQNML
jgi:hypothetical protein